MTASGTQMGRGTGDMLEQALDRYALDHPQAELIRHNENMTYKIDGGNKRYVLRIHKPVQGFSPGVFEGTGRAAFIKGELDILSDLGRASGLIVQRPVRGKDGGLVQMIPDGTPITLLEWVEGNTVEAVEQTPEICRDIGALAAKMHLFFEEKAACGKEYHRYAYDQAVLSPLADRIRAANRRKFIADQQQRVILNALDEMHTRFDELDGLHRKILVHGDLSKSNMIVMAEGGITPIDFSLSGYSHFYMDIGGLFGHITKWEDRRHILEGYEAYRSCELSVRYLEPYFALQVILFIACQYERAAGWEWFEGKLEQWSNEIFSPLAEGRTFLDIG